MRLAILDTYAIKAFYKSENIISNKQLKKGEGITRPKCLKILNFMSLMTNQNKIHDCLVKLNPKNFSRSLHNGMKVNSEDSDQTARFVQACLGLW